MQAEPGMPPAEKAAQDGQAQADRRPRARRKARAARRSARRIDPTMRLEQGRGPVAGRPSPRLAGGTEQEPDTDHEERHQVRQRAGHPHQDSGRRLIVERGQVPQPWPLDVVGIERPIGERQHGGQQRVLHVGQDQVRDQQPGRPSRPARVRPDDRIPEQQRRAEETDVLQVVPAVRCQRQLVDRREVPEPCGRREEQPGRHGVRQHLEQSARARASGRAGPTQYVRIGRGNPSSMGNSGAPSQSKGGATIISKTCWSIWTCSSRMRERLDRRGQGQEERRRAGPERDRLAARPAARDPDDAASASRAGRSRSSAGASRRPTARTARSARRRRRWGSSRPRWRHGGLIAGGRAGSWPSGRRLTRNSTRALISAGLICLP